MLVAFGKVRKGDACEASGGFHADFAGSFESCEEAAYAAERPSPSLCQEAEREGQLSAAHADPLPAHAHEALLGTVVSVCQEVEPCRLHVKLLLFLPEP